MGFLKSGGALGGRTKIKTQEGKEWRWSPYFFCE